MILFFVERTLVRYGSGCYQGRTEVRSTLPVNTTMSACLLVTPAAIGQQIQHNK